MERTRNPVQIGMIGIVLAVCVVVATLQYDRLPFLSGGTRFSALFTDAGGLMVGDDVTVSGVTVGKVDDIALAGQEVRVGFTVAENIELGDATRVDIKTNTILGRKSLRVMPDGSGTIDVHDTIPSSRTTSPYSLTDALGDLSTTVSDLNTTQLADAMDTASDTFADTPPELRAALDGITRLSDSINSRDETLQQLLDRAESVTGILADRSGQINQLVLDGNELFGELDRRRTAISQLITNISAVSRQLTAFVQENEGQIGPTLAKLNSVVAVLQKNNDNIAGALDGLGPYISALGESVASGPFFNAYIQNILPSSWWKAVVDSVVAPEQLPQTLQDLLPKNAPPILKPPGQ
ncbi:MCE family protein [Rhodococcus sp. BP-252]|uniref:Mammalian cell entry protein n=1 Tax=Rhodococcoides kyotonense TaxID=398843 RepID=A0A177YGQ1_9NOCA|nr:MULTISPECIES: MCE family protein [Rhodococcus]MBY6414687.1 MCE family protein [Rhodococcus sp. BP-320]MBY6419591.1 MCE family protein [Rhodococcus sp. BP-321]MBY6424575.1 MCE family protein [Rhodococcus sp. BP-324]MBY6429572.1 MCE family protein [Rhodococcus sp. BP-323]MBY6434544.1 MCE family protein [Rhodococcus sp. BP-322]